MGDVIGFLLIPLIALITAILLPLLVLVIAIKTYRERHTITSKQSLFKRIIVLVFATAVLLYFAYQYYVFSKDGSLSRERVMPAYVNDDIGR